MGAFNIFLSAFLFVSVSGHYITTPRSFPSCSSKVYCQGPLLDTVQRAHIFDDSKTFVDMKMKNTESVTLSNFDEFIKNNPEPNKVQIKQFVDENFEEGNEFEDWIPEDFTETPKLIDRINNATVKNFTLELVKIWKVLARKVKEDVFKAPEQYSLIPVQNGFIVPGGRFREFYYWDSYWVVRGLLQSDMTTTVRGMLENFIYIVKEYGFIPNGARVYYLNRSQPPLLTAMVNNYVKQTNDLDFLRENIQYLDQELQWWLDNRMTTVEKNGQKYTMAHYDVQSPSPRPESYLEDINTASFYSDEEDRQNVYCDLKAGAESGHDFSTRWFIDSKGENKGNLTDIKTRNIIPVDLNAILCQAFQIISDFYLLVNNIDKHIFWLEKAATLMKTIDEVHYDAEDGIWYDFNVITGELHKEFYATNFAPLWADAFDPLEADTYGGKAAAYLESQGILDYQGGIPSSLIQSGEQWDFPNAWPPLQAFVIRGLHKSGNCDAKNIAKELGIRWIRANMIGFSQTNEMFEKYDAVNPGQYGGGGEYQVQSGFGWTNGVVLDFIDMFYTNATKRT